MLFFFFAPKIFLAWNWLHHHRVFESFGNTEYSIWKENNVLRNFNTYVGRVFVELGFTWKVSTFRVGCVWWKYLWFVFIKNIIWCVFIFISIFYLCFYLVEGSKGTIARFLQFSFLLPVFQSFLSVVAFFLLYFYHKSSLYSSDFFFKCQLFSNNLKH